MKVRDAMTKPAITATRGTSVMSARRIMRRAHIRHLPVVDDDVLVGIVSDRDVELTDQDLAAALNVMDSEFASGRHRRLETVMSSPPRTIAPEATLVDAAARMLRHRIGALPVVDENARLVGIVTTSDCLRHVTGNSLESVVEPLTPMPNIGDERPGRPHRRPTALIINPDPAARLRLSREYEREGYDVRTCAGPTAWVLCPAVRGKDASPCPRVPENVDVIVVDQASARTRLLEAYVSWRPNARFVLTDGMETETAGAP